MLTTQPTPKGAGVLLWGDPFDLTTIHSTVHQLASQHILGPHLADFALGLAYDLRKAFENNRESQTFTCSDSGSKARYQGVRILRPHFLVQIALLRHSAGFAPSTRLIQSHLYLLESCAEKALLEYDPKTAPACIEWLERFSGLPRNYHCEYLNELTRRFVFDSPSGKSRFSQLPEILQAIGPYTDDYRDFDATISTHAALNACSPDDLHASDDWDDFEW